MSLNLHSVTGRQMIERWAHLADRRLEYLTELFETGRWRRFHTEVDLLDNIQEAKAAVARWRAMATQEATAGNLPVTWSWLDRPEGVPTSFQSRMRHEAPRALRVVENPVVKTPMVERPVVQDTVLETPVAAQSILARYAAEPVALKVSPALSPALPHATPARAAIPARAAAPIRPRTAPDPDWRRALDPDVLGERYPMLRAAV